VLLDKSSEDFVISNLRKESKCKDCLRLGGQAFFQDSSHLEDEDGTFLRNVGNR